MAQAMTETTTKRGEHWSYEIDAERLAWLTLDMHGSGTNVLSRAVMEELYETLVDLEAQRPRALLVRSDKKSGFIAGADIKEFTALEDPEQAFELIRNGQRVMDKLESLPFPSIALINGFALGGGLELALACRYRIVVDEDSARLGLPEVKLGIHPGFGGTVRATRLLDPTDAMDLMLTGRGLRPRAAKKIGLVDQVVPSRHLERAGRLMALAPPRRKKPGAKARLLNSRPARAALAKVLEKKVSGKAKKRHYPAPYAIIDLWKEHADDAAEMYEAEARSIAELMCTSTSRNLVRVFLLQDRLKSLGSKKKLDCRRVHVIGAGVMGGDIAAWAALRGMEVTLEDRAAEYIGPAIARAHQTFSKKLKNKRKVRAAMDRLMPDVHGDGVASADVVIEAIFENLEAKQTLFGRIEPQLKPGAVLATNTSSIRLEQIAGALSDPARLIGLHFFNPVAMMPLVEVIRSDSSRDSEIERGLAFARHIDKLPLPCASAPGFVVNRVLMPYMMEAFRAGNEGVPLAVIDKAATDFGMPMGPVELADTVGLDVALGVSEVFAKEFGMEVPERLRTMVEQKRLGRKTGRGFYEWRKGKPVREKDGDTVAPADLADRLILPMINEAVALLREGVVDDPDLLDAGVIFGTGFAPFTGGPLNYARARGVDEVVGALRMLAERHGPRFEPDSGWSRVAGE